MLIHNNQNFQMDKKPCHVMVLELSVIKLLKKKRQKPMKRQETHRMRIEILNSKILSHILIWPPHQPFQFHIPPLIAATRPFFLFTFSLSQLPPTFFSLSSYFPILTKVNTQKAFVYIKNIDTTNVRNKRPNNLAEFTIIIIKNHYVHVQRQSNWEALSSLCRFPQLLFLRFSLTSGFSSFCFLEILLVRK